MSDKVILNNYSDDAKIKQYITDVLAPRVFNDIPLNVLNTGQFSIINEYMSQGLEQQAFTSSFYFNEAFLVKAVLADSIYAEAAIFNKGYAFANPSSCNFLLELKIEDIYNNAVLNADTGLYEFILDKNTKFNLTNGNVYSLDYDILIQYKNIETSSSESNIPAWNVQYYNMDKDSNSVAKNKNTYIMYRVTSTWLCLFVQASEYERQTISVVNNMTNGIPNTDKVITCNNHIVGFDVKYVDGTGKSQFIPSDHILPIHANVSDSNPYIHYIMDNPQTIRFMFQLNGNKYFVPTLNSKYEITIYTCHGKSANFNSYNNEEQPSVITSTSTYSNNANIMKAAFVISGSLGGTDIGTTENLRRETMEAYNTSNVIVTDHDIDEWFNSFFFKNVLYPFFFKRRDDPWGKIWSGFLALKDTDDYVFRTNTLHAKIPYSVLYNNNDNTISSNEIIIPPGWIWVYNNENRYTITPYIQGDGVTIETAKTLANISNSFIFSNPFGIRIQKQPFAIGYFNPWVNDSISATRLEMTKINNDGNDISCIYHATPVMTNILRTYRDNYYKITTYISPTVSNWMDGSELVKFVRQNAVASIFTSSMWSYFNEPLDLFAANIPILPLIAGKSYIPFTPEATYFCVRNRNRIDDDNWAISDMWIDDLSNIEPKRIFIPITGDITRFYGKDKVWGENGYWKGHEVFVSSDVSIGISPILSEDSLITFARISTQNYYEMRLSNSAETGDIVKIVVSEAVETNLTKFGETHLNKIGKSCAPTTYINVYFANGLSKQYAISNAANIYCPYEFSTDEYGQCVFDMNTVSANGIILYADMKPSPDSGAVDYYRIPFSTLSENEALFYIENKLLPMDQNNMRVVLRAMINGTVSGMVEMQPVKCEADGSYRFEVDMHPLNQLVDIDNRISIASTENGGGSWIPTATNSVINLDATNTELKVSIFMRSSDPLRDSEITINDSFTGFRLVDEYSLDNVSLVSELKEMRSVVNFGETSVPTSDQMMLYTDMINLSKYDASILGNIFNLTKYSYDRKNGVISTVTTFSDIKNMAIYVLETFEVYQTTYFKIVSGKIPTSFTTLNETLNMIIDSVNGNALNWNDIWSVFNSYVDNINLAFENVNVNGGLEIQLVPFVEYSLLNSERFPSFVSAFTHVHEAIEPVISHRLEGNNYLDCKLIATYGLPHSYSADTDIDSENVFWPDLNIQLEFNVKLNNVAIASNTISELRNIIKSYFNRLTSIHTPVDLISMDNNIYISHVIQQLENHSNVAWLKFMGWYTNEKGIVDGKYMDATTQAIVQKWKKLEDFPKQELERFVPEMFTFDDSNIVINII